MFIVEERVELTESVSWPAHNFREGTSSSCCLLQKYSKKTYVSFSQFSFCSNLQHITFKTKCLPNLSLWTLLSSSSTLLSAPLFPGPRLAMNPLNKARLTQLGIHLLRPATRMMDPDQRLRSQRAAKIFWQCSQPHEKLTTSIKRTSQSADNSLDLLWLRKHDTAARYLVSHTKLHKQLVNHTQLHKLPGRHSPDYSQSSIHMHNG